MYKLRKLVLTNNLNEPAVYDLLLSGGVLGWFGNRLHPGTQIPKHLHLIDDSTIEYMDHFIDHNWPGGPAVFCRNDAAMGINSSYCKKIIASTDKTLDLPGFPQDFIYDYIEKYNNNNPVVDVFVKYDGDNLQIYKPRKTITLKRFQPDFISLMEIMNLMRQDVIDPTKSNNDYIEEWFNDFNS